MTIILHDRYDQNSPERTAPGARMESARSADGAGSPRVLPTPAMGRRIMWADDDLFSAIASAKAPDRTADSAKRFFSKLSSGMGKRRR